MVHAIVSDERDVYTMPPTRILAVSNSRQSSGEKKRNEGRRRKTEWRAISE